MSIERDRQMAEAEDDTQQIEVKVGGAYSRTIDHAADPFEVEGDDLKKVSGVDPSVRRSLTRKLEKVYTGAQKTGTKRLEDNVVGAYDLFGIVTPPHNLDYLARLNEISAPHYSAIKAKVANIVGLGFDLVESPLARDKISNAINTERAEKIRKAFNKHKTELYAWIDECNSDDEFSETLIKVWTDYEATGNGYFEIGRIQKGPRAGEIAYIGHIPSTSIRIRRERDGFVQMISNRVVFFRNFQDKKTTNPVGTDPHPNELIHIKKYSPTNSYYGVPDIVSAKQAVAGNEFSSRYNLDYFENKAVPRYVITLTGAALSPRSESNLLEFFEGMRGKNHRTLYIPIPQGTGEGKQATFKMEPIEAGIQDSSFNNYRKYNLNDILMAHRVPISKVGLAEGVGLATARDADKTFKEQVCRPEQKILEKKLNKIFAERTDAFVLKLNELTLTDEDTLSKMDERYLRYGVMVPNDIRVRRWGWEGIDDGDKPVSIMAQADMAAQQKATANATRTRDAERSANASDSDGEGRETQGSGRAVD